MPDWLLDGVEALVKDRLPSVERAEERVILTGEYTPFNLLVDNESGRVRLTGMFDFGDAMVGPPEYDLLGPSLFSCAGDAELVAALFRGYHGRERRIDRATRMRLLALAVLHRYANLDFQLRISGWRERARSLEELAVLIWPDGEAP
jgi:hygromycin-B 7''-O-kinase